MVVLIDPSSYRAIDDAVRKEGKGKGKGSVEVVNLAVHEEGEQTMQ